MTEMDQTSTVPQSLERLIDAVFESTPRLRYQKTRDDDDPPSVLYDVFTKPEVDLRLSFELRSEVLFVCFNECHLMAERARWEGRRKPNAFGDWCEHCVQLVRGILQSSKLKIVWVDRSDFPGPGGRLYQRQGNKWVCCGGEMFILFGKKKVYSDWY